MSENKGRRSLTQQEIEVLIQNGCTAADWSQIQVTDPFSPERIVKTHFSGVVSLGLLSGVVRLPGGVEMPCGIYHASLHNCAVGYNTLIRNVSDRVANMIIEDHVVINDVQLIVTEGQTTFGNGTGAAVVNENGGRAIPIYEGLSAQVAYWLAMYRHRPLLLQKLNELIYQRIRDAESDCGTIGTSACIQHCGVIKNVRVGPSAVLEGVGRLENGTIASCPQDPSHVGVQVIARDFIFAEGSDVSDGVTVTRCFVGQGARLQKGFTATDSVFFANSHFEQGEACSVFAGPFSVSHHKATLLIAGMCSFFNAGSGTNQSNHMYKLGPVHQGILERGCKTGSGSHLLWPARIGAFSTIIGKHSQKVDLSDLPFSCLLRRQEKSQLFPAIYLINVGLVRDEKKWTLRDGRKAPEMLDVVNTAVMTPYTAQKILAGIDRLTGLLQRSTADNLMDGGVQIVAATSAVELYRLALDRYFGGVLMRRIEAVLRCEQESFEKETHTDRFSSLKQYLQRKVDLGVSGWIDAAGVLAPVDAVELLLEDIQSSRLNSLDDIQNRCQALHTNYNEYEWAWVLNQLEAQQGQPLVKWSPDDFKAILEKGLEAAERLHAMVLDDASREFSLFSQVGYGIDDASAVSGDFEAVCGTYAANATIKMLADALVARKMATQEIISAIFA